MFIAKDLRIATVTRVQCEDESEVLKKMSFTDLCLLFWTLPSLQANIYNFFLYDADFPFTTFSPTCIKKGHLSHEKRTISDTLPTLSGSNGLRPGSGDWNADDDFTPGEITGWKRPPVITGCSAGCWLMPLDEVVQWLKSNDAPGKSIRGI